MVVELPLQYDFFSISASLVTRTNSDGISRIYGTLGAPTEQNSIERRLFVKMISFDETRANPA